MGFRGEALASIAAVSNVNLASRVQGGDGAFIRSSSTEVSERGSKGMAPGTSIAVDALFTKTPARLKYMKSAAAETARIKQILENLALSNTSISFSLKSDGKLILHTGGTGSTLDAFSSIYGPESASLMAHFDHHLENTPYAVTGISSFPSYNKHDRKGVKIFVNGRIVQNRFLTVAVVESYKGLLMEGRFPVCVINLKVPFEDIDVNVHPNKLEMRFIRESDAFISIQKPLRRMLMDLSRHTQSTVTSNGERTSYLTPNFSFDFSTVQTGSNQQNETIQNELHQPLGNLKALGQIATTYILAEAPDGLVIVDQHAAHESIIFYDLKEKWRNTVTESQPLLDPLIIETTQEKTETALNSSELLEAYGFNIEGFGNETLILRSIPSVLNIESASQSLMAILNQDFDLKARKISEAEWGVAASIACHSAIRAGQKLTQSEMQNILHLLEFRSDPDHCPHGRPTSMKINVKTLDREFGR